MERKPRGLKLETFFFLYHGGIHPNVLIILFLLSKSRSYLAPPLSHPMLRLPADFCSGPYPPYLPIYIQIHTYNLCADMMI